MASAGLMFMLVIPFFRKLFDSMRHMGIVFAALGIAALTVVLLISPETNGATITYTIAGFTFQPSEFVKILYILFLAAMLSGEVTVERAVFVSILAAIHVVVLVRSTDLGSALIFFVVYLMMLFLASGKWSVLAAGIALGAVGAVAGLLLFYHVQVRVNIWRDPFTVINNEGYQIAQSMFAISYGGLWGTGLTQGLPTSIPDVESDFMFSAITEEMGLIFSVFLLFLCLNCFIRILMLSASYSNRFFQLYTYGAAVCYIFQIFLTVGGETKFIPLTGVTLPLVSYGGSSIMSTLLMLGIVEMVYILHEERTAGFMQRYEQEQLQAEAAYAPANVEDDPYNGALVPSPGSPDSYARDNAGPDFGGDFSRESYSADRTADSFGQTHADTGQEYGPEEDNFPVNGVSEEGIFDNYSYQDGRPFSGEDTKTDHYGFYRPDGMKK